MVQARRLPPNQGARYRARLVGANKPAGFGPMAKRKRRSGEWANLIIGSPSPVDEKQLKEVHVRVIPPPAKT